MVSMWLLWLRNRRRGVLAVAVALIALVAVVFIARSGTIGGVAFLGNAGAPRAAAQDAGGAALPRAVDGSTSTTSLLDQPLSASAGPQTIEAAQAAWTAEETTRRRDEVLGAFNCARTQAGLPPLKLDAALSKTAGEAWLKLVHNPKFTLMDLSGHYNARGVLALDFTTPEQVAAQARQPQVRRAVSANAGGCSVGGFDTTAMAAEQSSATIGIAVFPPQASWDSASAVVLVR